MALHTLILNKETTLKLLGLAAIVTILSMTPVYAEVVKYEGPPPKNTTNSVETLEQEVVTLKVWVQTLQDQRNAILDQLAAVQVQLRQSQIQSKK